MKLATFNQSIEDLFQYYRYKPPENLDSIFKRIENVPDEAMPWICTKIMDELDNLPRNIGKAVKLNYQAWLSAHQKRVTHQMTKCPDCKSAGILWYSFHDEKMGFRYQFKAACGSCDNWRLHWNTLDQAGEMTAKAELIGKGYRLEGMTKDFPEGGDRRSLKEKTAEIGNVPPEKPNWCCKAHPPGHTADCPNNVANVTVPPEFEKDTVPDTEPDWDSDLPF